MSRPVLAFVESNTSGTGALFAEVAAAQRFRPLLLTADASRYPYVSPLGLDVLEIDTQDRAALLAACSRLAEGPGLAGITSSSEYFIPTSAALAESLGLPGPPAERISECRDKSTQRRKLRAAGVPVPEFRVVRSPEEAAAAAAEVGLPAVVKPVDGTGSLLVRLCHDREEAAVAAAAILARKTNERGMPLARHLLVEALAVGPEFSVETFGSAVIGITRKHVSPPPAFVEVGHDFPAVLTEGEAAAITDAAVRTLDALGLDWGPAHLELRLTAAGPRLIEVNPRLAGGFIPELVRLASGIDLVAQTITAVAGGSPRLERTADRFASIRFLLCESAGTLERFAGLEEARSLPGIAAIETYRQPGSAVAPQGDFRDRLGHLIACAATAEGAMAAAELGRARVRVVLA